MDLTDLAVRRGKTMTTGELAAKLQLINPNFLVRPSKPFPDRCNIFLPQWEKGPTGGWKQELVHITSCENSSHPKSCGWMPEFSVISTTDEIIPSDSGDKTVQRMDIEVQRGWRTVVANLLIKGVITRSDVIRQFGITPSHDSQRWHELTEPLASSVIATETIQ